MKDAVSARSVRIGGETMPEAIATLAIGGMVVAMSVGMAYLVISLYGE
jgi:hypothetical protein